MNEHMGHSYTKDRKVLMNRLSRLEGQVRGIGRMVDGEEYCVDILQQIAALRAAVDALGLLILEDHVRGCVKSAVEKGDADKYTLKRSLMWCAAPWADQRDRARSVVERTPAAPNKP